MRDRGRAALQFSETTAIDVEVKADNPYMFVTGCTRSGTTLLQRMLDNHPHLAVSNDTHLVSRTVLTLRPDPELPLTDDLVEQVVGYKRFDRLGVDASRSSSEPPADAS